MVFASTSASRFAKLLRLGVNAMFRPIGLPTIRFGSRITGATSQRPRA